MSDKQRGRVSFLDLLHASSRVEKEFDSAGGSLLYYYLLAVLLIVYYV